MKGQFFEIIVKKEYVDWSKGRPSGFYLWAKDREDLKRVVNLERHKDLEMFHIEKITEKGSSWNDIVK